MSSKGAFHFRVTNRARDRARDRIRDGPGNCGVITFLSDLEFVPALRSSTMDTRPKLLLDNVYEVLGLVEHSPWAPQNISRTLQSCALVSKGWNAITRPLILQSLSISFTDLANERIATLHEILDGDPSSAGRVRRLKLRIQCTMEMMINFEECGTSLLALVKRFTGLTHLLVDPSDSLHPWIYIESYWIHAITDPQRESLTHILTLPSLQVLDLRGLELPPSIFVHHPNLEHLILAYGWEWIQHEPPLVSPYTEGFSALKSLTIHLHGVVTKSEVVDTPQAHTLSQMLDTHPQLFRSLASLDVHSLVEKIQDLRAVLHATRGTLEHFACGLTWQRLEAPDYNPWYPPSLSEIEETFKLDFEQMLHLTSIELRYDSPESLGFPPTFQTILSTLNTIQWKTIEKFKLILVAEFPKGAPHTTMAPEEYCYQLDDMVSKHTIASGKTVGNRLDEIQLWILHNCHSNKRKATCRPEMKLQCHVWENYWHPEHEAYLIGGWKMTTEDKAEFGIVD
ncbi:hypothetical protein BKA70DRAFT_1237517 [Coprinopsis sp. MPI-PUGE-AT-0042]|nr:hypothetical protein BKA70DRAFT_1237517 [Coprinopsis sp. MPI-PUGE-AT-0042]